MLKRNKRRKIDDAASKLAQLDAVCQSLQGDTAAAFRKLEELKDLLEDAKAKQGRKGQNHNGQNRNLKSANRPRPNHKRQTEKQPDPNSPFAVLATLKTKV